MEYPASDPASINSSTVKMSRPPGRSASADAATTSSQRSKIHEGVGRHNHVERPGAVAQVGGQLDLEQLVVDVPAPRLAPACARTGRPPPAGAHTARRAVRTSPVPHPASSTSRLFDASTPESASIPATSVRGAVQQLGELGIEAGGEAVEGLLDEPVRRPRRDIAAGARREHVQRNRMVRLLLEPFFEDLHRLVDLAERAVRQRQQPPRFGVLRPERDDLAEADDRFVRPLLAVQQDAQVGVRVRVVGIDANGGSIGRFRFDQLALRPQEHAEIVVRVGMIRIERNRALERGDRLVQLQAIPQDDAQIAVPVRPIGLELEAPLDQRDGLARSAPAGGRARPRSAARRDSRARPRGSCGRCRPPPPTARSAAAGSRSRSPRPG